MPIEWNESLKTGIPIIDSEHQELIVMLNRLGRFRCGEERFTEAFEELQYYADNHFKVEENYMLKLEYPEYDEHKSFHDKFKQDLEAIHKRLNEPENILDLGMEVYDFAGDWIINHYSNEDIKLANYIKQHS